MEINCLNHYYCCVDVGITNTYTSKSIYLRELLNAENIYKYEGDGLKTRLSKWRKTDKTGKFFHMCPKN